MSDMVHILDKAQFLSDSPSGYVIGFGNPKSNNIDEVVVYNYTSSITDKLFSLFQFILD